MSNISGLEIVILTASSVVSLTAFYILVRLGVKGYKNKTFCEYLMVYCIFLNILLVWFLMPLRILFIYLQPISTLLFAIKYVKTTTAITKPRKICRNFVLTLQLFSVIAILGCLITFTRIKIFFFLGSVVEALLGLIILIAIMTAILQIYSFQ